jgi:hypothetical protein
MKKQLIQIFALACLTLMCLSACKQTIPFDSAVWKKSDSWEQETFPRQGMAQDLINNRKLNGQTRAEVIELLGEPDSEREYEGGHQLNYWLGPDSGYGIDSEWLMIELDDAGRVMECRTWED